nr:hypothetical protein [uncultured Prevotella sp.]
MVDIAAVKEFIQHPEYVYFIERLQKERGLYLSEDLPSFTILNYSANTINKSKVSIKELLNLLSAEKESLYRYVLACIDRASKDDDLEEEYPEGEEQDPSEDPNDGVLLPGYRDFAIFPMVLFYIIKNQPNEVLPFLMALRWPHAKANAKKELLFYKEVLGV